MLLARPRLGSISWAADINSKSQTHSQHGDLIFTPLYNFRLGKLLSAPAGYQGQDLCPRQPLEVTWGFKISRSQLHLSSGLGDVRV